MDTDTGFKDIEGWRRDETNYIVFKCLKCRQYIYVKATQKTKKCLRCGRSHQVKKINGEIVKGMTAAVENVKKNQNELALKEIGAEPDLRTINDFSVVRKPNKSCSTNKVAPRIKKAEDYDYSEEFKEILIKLSRKYKRFPDYMVKMMAKEENIPDNMIEILLNQFKMKGLLVYLKNSYYTFKTD